MLRICRAEDGVLFQVDATLWDIERRGNLEQFLESECGVPEDAVLAYLSDGSRLMTENIRELAGSQDDTIYVFNKHYLDYDLREVLTELRIEPSLQPPIEDAIASTPPFRPSQLASAHLQAARAHQETVSRVASATLLQHEALRIALHSLDLNVLSMSDAFESFANGARAELAKQDMLLDTLELDLHMVSQVKIHPEFMSANVRRAIENGEKERTLGDYVSDEKMRQVAEGCSKMNYGLKTRFVQAQESMSRLTEGSDRVRATLQTSRLLDDAEASKRRAQDLAERTSDIATRLEKPGSSAGELMKELKDADTSLRREVETITDIKNASTELCIGALRQISELNVDLVQLPSNMSTLQSDFRSKTSFNHIQRLHNMIYAYGATLIEIVRRKEFSRFFYQRAQVILEVMAKLTSAERKRRQIFRGDVHGQLPFEIKGLNDSVPHIDFTPSGGKDLDYSLERADMDRFMQVLGSSFQNLQDDAGSSAQNLSETLQALEKLIARMDGLESSFDRIVERSLLSASKLSQSRRRLTDAEDAALQERANQISSLQQEMAERVEAFNREKEQLNAEIVQLNNELRESFGTSEGEKEHVLSLEREIRSLKAQSESDAQARKVLEQRHSELLADVQALRKGQAEALSNATDKAKEAETLHLELCRTRDEFAEVKEMEMKHSQRIAQLLEDQTTTLRKLEEARLRGDDLEGQIKEARQENDDMNLALKDAGNDKDRLLRAQALEHDRIMRDHIAEADGDRAILEQQFFEVKAAYDNIERQLKEARSETEVLNADVTGLREELQRCEHELREAKHVERVLRNDLSEGRASQSDFEHKISDRDRLLAETLNVAIALHHSCARAMSALQPLSVHPGAAVKSNTTAESVLFSPLPRNATGQVGDEPSPIDPADPHTAVDLLRAFDLDAFSETVGKVASVIRKWQKQCKEYRDRSKGKISFRNFAKGDLALFLPTRNSVSRPWAAFNVSFPHYFLQASGQLAEQLKTREWIVARITSIAERVVDPRIPDSNPYGLGDGVKYFMLDVEDWTRPGNDAKQRRSSTRQLRDEQSSPPSLERPISPPPAEPSQSGASAAEPLGATRSPNSHLFPVRTRSNSATAGPSSLSRILAQAPAESPLETIPATPPLRSRTPSPTTKLPPAAPPSPTRVAALAHSPVVSSPLRPGSRASGSTSSRMSFSGGRIAPFPRSSGSGTPSISKAAATTALSSEVPLSSPPATSLSPVGDQSDSSERLADSRSSTPSPTQSASEGMTNVLIGRRRTASEHVSSSSGSRRRPITANSTVGTSATSALANLANSWVIGRRKKTTDSGPQESQ